MKRFINELKYLNRGMPTFTKIILGVIAAYIFISFGENILFNPSIFINIAILIFSLLVHEISHGLMAYICGDSTAKNYGRLSLNPLHHLDPLGTIFPILLILSGSSFVFGWAKPVPINYYRLKYGRVGEFLVAIAGVLSNIILAIIGMILFKHFYEVLAPLHLLKPILYMISLNILLAVFNIIPIPPLDGSRVLASIGSYDLRDSIFHMDRYGIFIIMILSWTGILYKFIAPAYMAILSFLDKLI